LGQAVSWVENHDVNMFFIGAKYSFLRNKADEIGTYIQAIKEI